MSDTDGFRVQLAGVARTQQIIVAAMCLGLVAFLVVALVLQHGGFMKDAGNATAPLLSYIALAYAVAALVARVFVPELITASNRRKIARGTWRPPNLNQGSLYAASTGEGPEADAAKFAAVSFVRTIITAALVESAGLFAIVAYLLEGQVLALVCAVVMVALLVQFIPTRAGLEHWIDEQVRRLELER